MVPGMDRSFLGSRKWRKSSEPSVHACSVPIYTACLLRFQVAKRVLWWCGELEER